VLAIDGWLQKTLALRSGFYTAHKLPFVNINLRAFFAVKQHFKDREAGEALAALGGAGEVLYPSRLLLTLLLKLRQALSR
jgi:hypothetical protein